MLLVIPQQSGTSAKAKGERENMFPAEANAIGQEDGPSDSFRRGLHFCKLVIGKMNNDEDEQCCDGRERKREERINNLVWTVYRMITWSF